MSQMLPAAMKLAHCLLDILQFSPGLPVVKVVDHLCINRKIGGSLKQGLNGQSLG